MVQLGVTYIQLDTPHYPLSLQPRTRAFYEEQGWTLEQWLGHGIKMDNAVIGDVPYITFGFHL